jgi:hypothetical protein
MAIKRKSFVEWIGLAADTKPTSPTPETGSSFRETDTGRIYYWTGSAWLSAGSVINFNLYIANLGATTVQYQSVPTPFQIGGTESSLDLVFDYALLVTRFRLALTLNTRTQNTIISFRDDGADVTGTPITIPAAGGGEMDSGALTSVVTAGSKINFKYDPATAGGTGNITCFGLLTAIVLLQ